MQQKWCSGLTRFVAVALVAALFFTTFSAADFVSAAGKKTIKTIQLTKPAVQTLALQKGEKYKLNWKVTPKNLKKKVKITSGKKSVVNVGKNGVLKAKKAGKATITIQSKTKPKKTVKLKVTVHKKLTKAKKVSLNQKSAVLAPGGRLTLKATISPKKATVKKVTYSSSEKSVATVSQKGIVAAKKEGTAKITAYAQDGRGAKAVCNIKVQKKSADVEPTSDPGTGTPSTAPTAKPSSSPIQDQPYMDKFLLSTENQAVSVYIDESGSDYDGMSLVAESFAGDMALVSEAGASSNILTKQSDLKGSAIIVGSIGNNDVIDSLIEKNRVEVSDIKGKWETYKIQVIENPTDQVGKAIVVIGSDKRGAIYGLYHISEMMGVSPWVYWGDALPDTKKEIVLEDKDLTVTSKEPSVKYRGIFLNDEAPSLTGWVKDKFGDYNEEFYKHVYELILRCKGNYLWPAMWSNSFSDDGKEAPIANAELADRYGIVMGTSHHEPLCRAGVEWQRIYKDYGSSNAWDFNENGEAITKFWQDGVKRNKAFENVYTLGMRGEADSSLGGTVAENIQLLKDVITTQKNILKENALSDAPQVLTVYKEVEDFWHGNEEAEGLKKWNALDDVTIMLCDDNFGNMRTLPVTEEEINRKGGWGMYYHFDYHGGPTSYEWVNTVELNKVWEQMTMAYEHGIDDIWIVNVGDLKPMEMNISYFLDMAYDYDTWGAGGLNKTETYRRQWVKQQFGSVLKDEQVEDVDSILKDYTWLNGSCKPETLNSGTYHVTNYNEAMEMLGRIEGMIQKADQYKEVIPEKLQAAYFELVYFPAVASATVAKIQIYAGLNTYYYDQGSMLANLYASLLEQAVQTDQDLEYTYNSDMPGVGDKWKNMMSSPHVGFVTWNSTGWSYPQAKWLTPPETPLMLVNLQNQDYVGKNVGGKTALTELPYDHFVIPGVMDAAAFEGSKEPEQAVLHAEAGKEYAYPVIVTGENTYQFSLSAKSEQGAQVKLLWNDKVIGTLEIGKEDTIYRMESGMALTPGQGIITLKAESGSADIEYIKAGIKDSTGSQAAFLSASSEQSGHGAVFVYDGENKTTWMPEDSDAEKWIVLDFDSEYYFDRFALVGTGVTGYQVQVQEGDKWNTVYTGTEITKGTQIFIQGKKAIKSQKLRFVFEGTDIEIAEIDVKPYVNWAMEDNVTVSGEKNSGGSISVPASVADGDRITKGMEASVGASSDAGRHLVTMEFEQPRTIDTVRVVSLQSSEATSPGSGTVPDFGMTSDRAQYSYRASYYDGDKWTEIGATVRPNSGDPKVFSEFTLSKPVQAQAVRLEIYTSNWIRINEFEAVQTQKFQAVDADTEKEFTAAATQFDVDLSKELSMGRIVLEGAYDPSLAFSYYNKEKAAYESIDAKDMDVIRTADGCYAIPAKEIVTSSLRITSEKKLAITNVVVYEAAKWQEVPEGCQCDLQSPVFKGADDIVIPYGKDRVKIPFEAEAAHGSCQADGHENGVVSYRYALSDNSDGIAELDGTGIRFLGNGSMTLRIRAELNGYVRYGMKTFAVTKATEVSDTYKNYAAAANGGEGVVPTGGEGPASRLIDGDKHSNDGRWRIQASTAYAEVYFDGLKDIDKVYFYSQQNDTPAEEITDDMTSTLAQKDLTFSYLKDGKWVKFEGGTITGNDKVKCGIELTDSVRTPAIRVDVESAVQGWIHIMEIEAYGEKVDTTGCQCQLGTPALTCGDSIEVDKETSLGSLTLNADAVYYSRGCKEQGHSTGKPSFTYAVVQDDANIASISGNELTVNGMGTVKIRVTASLNGISKSADKEISAVKSGYTNFALASNGSTATSSDNYDTSCPPENVIDGNTSFSNSKRWRTTVFPAYLEIDFGQSRAIDRINLFSQQDSGNITPTLSMTGKYAITDFNISYWDGAANEWKELKKVTSNKAIWYQLVLDQQITTSRIRIDIPSKVCDGWARIVEIEAWGYAD